MQTRSALQEKPAAIRPPLDPDRYFDPDPQVRRIARELYEGTRELPLICPHGHVDPALLAGISVGDRVDFTAERAGGQYRIVELKKN